MRRLVRCDEDDSTFDELSASVSSVGPPVSPRCSTDHVHSTSVPSSSVPVPSYSGGSHQATADSTPGWSGSHDRDGGQESTSTSWLRAGEQPPSTTKELPGWVAQRKTGEHQARELKTQEFVRKRSMALGSSTAAGGRKGKGEGPGNQNLAEALARAPSLVLEPRPLDEQDYSFKTEVIAGICAGVVQVLLFNPYDRALYLSSIHQRPFLHTKQKRSEERNHATIPSIVLPKHCEDCECIGPGSFFLAVALLAVYSHCARPREQGGSCRDLKKSIAVEGFGDSNCSSGGSIISNIPLAEFNSCLISQSRTGRTRRFRT